MAQLYLFTGENAFQLREERRTWKERFVEKHGEENLLTLSGSDVTYRTLLDEVSVAPFIGGKRLVVIDGVPRFEKEDVEALSGQMHPDCLVLICDAKPDKRLGGVKALLKVAEVKEMLPLHGGPLEEWARAYASSRGAVILQDAVRSLIAVVGEDQETLSHELDKLLTYAAGKPVTTDTVVRLAVPSGEQEVWQLTNDLAQGRTDDALRYAQNLLRRGEDPFSLWSVLLWMLRNLVTVHAAALAGDRNPATIAKLGVPFPTARTLLPVASRMKTDALRDVVEWAGTADVDLKTGTYRATGEAPQELTALIDALIIRCGAAARA